MIITIVGVILLLILVAPSMAFATTDPSSSHSQSGGPPPDKAFTGTPPTVTSEPATTTPSDTSNPPGDNTPPSTTSTPPSTPTPNTTPPPAPTSTPSKIVQCPNGSISVNGSPCPKTKFPCNPSTPNMSNTCIFIIHKTVNHHTNSVQQVAQPIFIQGIGFVIPTQCKLMTSTQIECNFTLVNNAAVLH